MHNYIPAKCGTDSINIPFRRGKQMLIIFSEKPDKYMDPT
jgi:hypothetical protein